MVEWNPHGGQPGEDQDAAMSSTEAAPRPGFLEDDDTQPIATATPDQAAPASGPIPAEWGRYPVSEVRYPPPRTPMRPITVIVVAAVTALLIGSAAGFGGARLAGVTAEPATSTAPRTPPVETAAPIPPAPRQAGTVEVAKTVVPSTVMIKSGAGSTAGTGSGFVLDIFGRIMTNNHVVEDAADGDRIDVVFSNGRRARATILGRSPSYDLAVIKVAASRSLVPIRVGDSDTVQVGETVLAVGAPLALPGTVTEGIISSRDRPVVVNGSDNADAPSAYINAIQTDAPINPGNSGGPLVDAGARVIGVNSAILTLGETRTQSGNIGLGFAIPINQAMDIGKMLIKNGRATYPVIGANVRGASGSAGVELTEVESNGPADDAGLRKGDKITAIDGRPVDAIEQLIVLIRTHRPGDVVKLTYRRGGSQDEARVTLGSKEG